MEYLKIFLLVFFLNSLLAPDPVTAALRAVFLFLFSALGPGFPMMAFWHKSRMSSYLNPTPRLSPAIKSRLNNTLIPSSGHRSRQHLQTDGESRSDWISFNSNPGSVSSIWEYWQYLLFWIRPGTAEWSGAWVCDARCNTDPQTLDKHSSQVWLSQPSLLQALLWLDTNQSS